MNLPTDLLLKIASGDCVVYVGAGLSRGAGLPDWPQLLKQMIVWCESNGVRLPHSADIENAIIEKKYLMAAEELIEKMGDEEFRCFMSEVFLRPGLMPTQAHELLVKIPFAAALTSNYDTLVEAAYIADRGSATFPVFSQQDVPELSNILRAREFYVLKTHGTIDRVDTIVLSGNQYRELMHNNPAYKQFLSSLLSTKTVLFIGFSLTDPDLELVLNELQAAFAGFTGTHYALMDVSNIPAFEQNRWAHDFNIEFIPYTPSASDHPEVRQFLSDTIKKLPKLILWQTMIKTLEPTKKILNSDSHYRLVMNTDNKIVVQEKYDGAAKEKPLSLSVQLRFDTKTSEGREAHEEFKRHLATGERITIKSPHLEKFIPPDILSLLMPDQLESIQVTMGPAVGNATLPVKLIIEPNDGDQMTVDNIILKNVQSGDDQMILSNEHQGIPWNVRQVLRLKENQSAFTITFSDFDLNVKQSLDGWRVFDGLSKGGQLRIESIETGKQLGDGKFQQGCFKQVDPRLLEVLEALTYIQSKTTALFETPGRISYEQAKTIFFTVEILKTGKGEFNTAPLLVESRLEQAKFTYERFRDGESATTSNYIDGFTINVLDQWIYLGTAVLSCQVHMTATDLEELRTSIESGDQSELHKVQLTPTPGSFQEAKFVDWLPEDEAERVRGLPFFRSNSLKCLIRMLFDAAKHNDGAVDIDQLLSLLNEARSQTSEDGTPLNLLSECSSIEFREAFVPKIAELTQDEAFALANGLCEVGWLSAGEAALLADVDETTILKSKSLA